MATTTDHAPVPGSVPVPARGDVPIEQTWDLTRLFPAPEEWDAAYAAAEARLPELEDHRGRLGASAAALLAGLVLRDEIYAAVERVTGYAGLRASEDATDAGAAAMFDRAAGLTARFQAAAAFFGPELVAISAARWETFLAEEPGLAPYRFALERVRRMRPHVRSAEVEEVIALAAEPIAANAAAHTALEDGDLPLGTIADERGATVPLRQGNLDHFLHSADARVRREAWEASADAYLDFKHVFAATLGGGVKGHVFQARARRYGSSLEAALAPDAIPTGVFQTLVETVWRNLPVWHRYFAVRRRLLGLPDGLLHPADLTAPLAAKPPVIPWQEGVELILDSLAPLGADYVGIVRQGIAERWVDRCANAGKGAGAFSEGPYRTLPYISMVYGDDLGGVSTLTHELGHSLHSYHAWEQPIVYWPYAMFTAEAASNMHQALLGAHLLALKDDRDWQLAVLEERMANHLRYLFTMPILARFELDCHQRVERGEALTADGMNAALFALYEAAYGGQVALDRDRMGITWARFSHLFTGFYVFQYATGISAAAALAAQVRAEGDLAARRYVAFLRAGGHGDPIDLLRATGVDLSTPEPVQRAFDILAGYVERLEGLAG